MKEFTRDKRVTIRLNANEWRKLVVLCGTHGKTPSQFLRDKITQARIK